MHPQFLRGQGEIWYNAGVMIDQMKSKGPFGRIRGAWALAFAAVAFGASAASLPNPSFDGNANGWTLWQCAYDATVSCDGIGGSLRFERAANEEVGQGQALAHCIVELNQPEPSPFVYGCSVKTKDLSEEAELRHALFGLELRVTYADGSEAWAAPRACFDGGTHDWQRIVQEFRPIRPIRRVTLYARSRRAGTAWFDGFVFRELPPPRQDLAGCAVRSKDGLVTLENAYLRAVFEPALGGTCRELLVKATGENFAGATHPEARLFTDRLRVGGNTFKRPYEAEVVEESADAVELRLRLLAPPGYPFLEVAKSFRLERLSSALSVRYVYRNLPEAMADSVIEPYFRLAWTLRGVDGQTYYLPTPTGVRQYPSRGHEVVVTNAVAGWVAAGCEKTGASMVCELDYSRLAGNYLWLGGDDNRTVEWWFVPVKIPAGGTFETDFRLYPVRGIGVPDGAENGIASGRGLAGGCGMAVASAARRLADVSVRTVGDAGQKGIQTDVWALTPDAVETRRMAPSAAGLKALRVAASVGGVEAYEADRAFAAGLRFAPKRKKAVPAEMKPFALTLSDAVVSPHTAWARPFAGGRPTVLFLTDLRHLREAVELKERVDLRPLAVRIASSTTELSWGMSARYNSFTYEDMNLSLKGELAKNPQVLVACGDLMAKVDAANRARIADRLKRGMGLVAIDARFPDDLAAALSVAAPSAADDPLRGLPKDLIPHRSTAGKAAVSVAGVSELGNRSVVFRYDARGGGLTPYLDDATEEPDFRYADYSLGAIGRAVLWAAGLSSGCRLSDVALSSEGRLTARRTGGGAVRARVMTRNVPSRTQRERTAELGAAQEALALDVGPLGPGLNICDLVLLDAKGATLDWAHAVCRVETGLAVQALDADWKGGAVVGMVRGTGEAAVRLFDGGGRLLATAVPDAAGDFVLKPQENPTGIFTVEATVSRGGVVHDRRRCDVFAPRPPPEEPCLPFAIGEMAQRYGLRRYLSPLRLQRYHDGGVNEIRFWHTETCRLFRETAKAGFGTDFPVAGTHLGNFLKGFAEPYAKTGDRAYLCRKPCFDDPAWRTNDAARVRSLTRAFNRFAPASLDAGDENSLTLWSIPFDFCFCDRTLAAFRDWLKGQYGGSLDRLNAEWRSEFRDWRDVVPLTTAEARERHKGDRAYAAWADHRRYMEISYCGYFASVKRIISEEAPGVRLDMSGTQPPNGYTGMDMWLLADAIDIAAAYDSDNLAEIMRSFGTPLIKPWYGYGATGPDVGRRAWFDAFRFRNFGVSFYDGMNFLDPDYTLPKAVTDLQAAVADLRRGGGMLLRRVREVPQALIHYSQASIHAAAIEGRSEAFLSARSRWCKLLDDAHVPYRFVAYGEIERGVLREKGCPKILALPQSAALSDREAAEIAAFARRGGLVLGDALSNVMNEHCTLRPRGGLDGLVAFDLAGATVASLMAQVGAKLPPREIVLSETPGQGVRAFVYHPADGGRDRYLGFVRETYAKGPDVTTVNVSLPGPRHIHDMRRARSLGCVPSFEVKLGKAEAAFYAILPEVAGRLELHLPETVRRGEAVAVTFALPGLRFSPVDVTVTDPTGARHPLYSRVVPCMDGRGTRTFQLALNDRAGTWRVRAQDFVGGSVAEGTFTVTTNETENEKRGEQ